MMGKVNSFLRANWYWFAAFFLILVVKLVVIYVFGSPIPFWDQWDGEGAYMYKNIVAGTFSVNHLIEPHNEHRLLTNRLLSLLIFYLNGQRWNVIIEMVVNAILHSATIVTLLVLLAKSFEKKERELIALLGTIIFILPVGWENTLHGFSSHFYFFILCSVIFLANIYRTKPFSFKWFLFLFFGALSFFSLASGVLTLGSGAAIIAFGWIKDRDKDHKKLLAAALILGVAFACYLITPVIAQNQAFRSTSVWAWLFEFAQNLSWPFPAPFAMFYIPSLWLFYSLLRKKDSPNDEEAFHAGMLILLIGTFGLLAYSRALNVVASRYKDLMVPAIMINFVIVLRAVRGQQRRKLILGTFILIIAASVPIFYRQSYHGVMHRFTTSQAQLVNVTAYLCDGHIEHLLNKQPEEIPYPDPIVLQSYLDDPDFEKFLPIEINPSLNDTLCAK